MRLSLRQKQEFYQGLAKLVRSGMALPAALRLLSKDAAGVVRSLSVRLADAIEQGDSAAEAFRRMRPAFTEMEVSVIAASERAGRLDQGCERLAQHFGAISEARRVVIRKTLYPAFVLHFGILVVGVPRIFLSGGGVESYLRSTFSMFAFFYGVVAIVWIVGDALAGFAKKNGVVDRIWRTLPVVGKIHAGFSLARFCATYEMLLNSGISVVESLATAGRASLSGAIRRAVERIAPEVQAGNQVGPLLARTGAFPTGMIRAFRLGEETGGLDDELRRLAEDYQTQAFERVEALSEWIPRLLYVAILGVIAYSVVGMYREVLGEYQKVLDW